MTFTTKNDAASIAYKNFPASQEVGGELDDSQKETFRWVNENIGPVEGGSYLVIAAGGVDIVRDGSEGTDALLKALIKLAGELRLGKDLSAKYATLATPLARLEQFADTVKATAAVNGEIDAAGLEAIREGMTVQGRVPEDNYDGSIPQLSALSVPVTAITLPEVRVDKNKLDPTGDKLRGILGTPLPERRLSDELIPGTMTPWTPEAIAEILEDRMGGNWDGTKDEKHILDITHGLHIEDRKAVAMAYARLRGHTTIDPDDAFNALYEKICSELDDMPFEQTRDGLVIKAQFDPHNPTGQLLPHDMIMLDSKGFFNQNGSATLRLLQECSKEQCLIIDAAMREKYDIGLNGALILKYSVITREALFLVNAPREAGDAVSDASRRAFQLRESVLGFGTDEEKLFAQLEQMTTAEFRETAEAYHALNTSLWRNDVKGAADGPVETTALYQLLHGDLNDFVGGDDLWLKRLDLAAGGLRFDGADTNASESLESDAQERLAEYVAVSLRLAGKGKTSERDVIRVLGLVAPTEEPSAPADRAGRPKVSQVLAIFKKSFPNSNLWTDVDRETSGEANELARVTLDGDGYNTASAAAIRIHNALEGGFLGLAGIREEVIYEVLDRSDLTAEQRGVFLGQLNQEFSARYGEDLRKVLADELDVTLKLPVGKSIESRAMRLLDHGILTPAERMVYAIHEPRSSNIFGHTEGDTVMGTNRQLSPLAKVVAMSEYARIMGKEFDPTSGAPSALWEDVRALRGRDARRAAQFLQVMPQDVASIAADAGTFLDATKTDPKVEKWLAENFQDTDATMAGLQSSGLKGLRTLVGIEGQEKFGAQMSLSQEQMVEQIQNLVTDARGNALSELMMDFFGPHGAGVEVYARKVGAAVRDAEIDRRGGKEITDEHRQNIKIAYDELVARVADYDELKDATTVEMSSNVALAVAIAATLAAAPGVSPLVLLGVGAVTKAGTYLTFGERDAVTLVTQALRGGVGFIGDATVGLATHYITEGLNPINGTGISP